MGPVTALKQLRKEVANIDFSLQGIKSVQGEATLTTWGSRPAEPREEAPANGAKILQKLPASRTKLKGTWVPRLSHLHEIAARPGAVASSVFRQLGDTEGLLTGWSSGRHTRRSADPGSPSGGSNVQKNKLSMSEWVKVCDTYPVSPRRLSVLTGIGSDGSPATMVELGPAMGGQRRQVDLSVEGRPGIESTPPHATPRGMARAVVPWRVHDAGFISDSPDATISKELLQTQDLLPAADSSATDMMTEEFGPSGLNMIGDAVANTVFQDEKPGLSIDLQIPSRAITGCTISTSASATTSVGLQL
jgi:hypothetical protein